MPFALRVADASSDACFSVVCSAVSWMSPAIGSPWNPPSYDHIVAMDEGGGYVYHRPSVSICVWMGMCVYM
jgi:hypothetical protein